MPVSIRPLHPVFAGEVSGVDCRKPLVSGEIDAVEAGMNEYAVLVFRDQNLTDEEQIAFTRHFGELENYNTPGHVRKREDQRLGPGIADFSNLDKHGNIMSDEDRVGSSSWATGCGTPTARSARFRRNIRCSPGGFFPHGAPTPNSPICAPLMTRWIIAPRSKSGT